MSNQEASSPVFGAQIDFGVSLLKELFQPTSSTSSLVFSPLSLLSVLSMINVGAKHKTARDLRHIIGHGTFLFVSLQLIKYAEYLMKQLIYFFFVNLIILCGKMT